MNKSNNLKNICIKKIIKSQFDNKKSGAYN